jgi:hypothetical protein
MHKLLRTLVALLASSMLLAVQCESDVSGVMKTRHDTGTV